MTIVGAQLSGADPEAEQFPMNSQEAAQQEPPVADPAFEHTDGGQPADQGVQNGGENVIPAQEVEEHDSSNVKDPTMDRQNATDEVVEPVQATIDDREEKVPTDNEMLLDGKAGELDCPIGDNQAERAAISHSKEAVEEAAEQIENAIGNGVHNEDQLSNFLDGSNDDDDKTASPMEIDELENTDQNNLPSRQEVVHNSKNGTEESSHQMNVEENAIAIPNRQIHGNLETIINGILSQRPQLLSGNEDDENGRLEAENAVITENQIASSRPMESTPVIVANGDERLTDSEDDEEEPYDIDVEHDDDPVDVHVQAQNHAQNEPDDQVPVDEQFHEFQDRNRSRFFGNMCPENLSINNDDDIEIDIEDDSQLGYDGDEVPVEEADSPGTMNDVNMNIDDGFDEEMECSRKRCRQEDEERPSSPMTDEEIDALLRAAGVTRFQAGFPEAKRSRMDDFVIVHDHAVSSNADQVADDLQFALSLQEEEDRHFNESNFCEEIPPPPPPPPPPAEKRDNRGNQGFWREKEKPARVSKGRRDESFLVQQMWNLYEECKSYRLKRIPRPLSVPGNLNMMDYIHGYRRALRDGRFPDIGEDQGLDMFDEDEEAFTAMSPDRIIQPSIFPEKNRFAHTAFQNFVESANAMINRSTLPEEKEEEKSTPSRKRPRATDEGEPSTKKKENPIGFIGPRIPFADLSPPICNEEEFENYEEDEEVDVCNEPIFETDDSGFAVPTVPHRGRLFDDSVFEGPFESSPAARHVQILHYRNTKELRESCAERSKYKDYLCRLVEDHHPDVVRPSGPEGASTSSAGDFSDDFFDDSFRRRLESHPDLNVDQNSANPDEGVVDTRLPRIQWEDVERMPPLAEINRDEIHKMPSAYRTLIENYQRRPPPPPLLPHMQRFLERVKEIDEKSRRDQNQLEHRYLGMIRRLIPTPNRIPPNIFGSKFEIYIRFPILKRPKYVKEVLKRFNIPDNERVLINWTAPEYRRLSMAELCKKGVNAWLGRTMNGQSVKAVLSKRQTTTAANAYFEAITEKLTSVAKLIGNKETREGALSFVESQAHSILRDDVNVEDISQLHDFEFEKGLELYDENGKPHGTDTSRQLKVIARAFTVRADVVEYDIDLSDEEEEIEKGAVIVEEEEVSVIVEEEVESVIVEEEVMMEHEEGPAHSG